MVWNLERLWHCCHNPRPIRLSLGRQNFLNTHLIDKMFSLQIDEMCSLFSVGEIRPDPLCHDHNEVRIRSGMPGFDLDQ
jgi:hypothetical protein